jgi:ABC-2 type transport system ATP-binding protein
VEWLIQTRDITKRYGAKVAVQDLSFSVRPGMVTGFLGPNGAGKSTTMRLILGLDRPTNGAVTVNGKPFQQSADSMHEVGALLDANAVHGGRSVRSHLMCLAQSNGLPRRRVQEVLELVGLDSVAKQRCRELSLGMKQRLGIGAAVLGDPGILMFDEPVNGLDPEGILWIRTLMKSFAAEGRTVFVSSHLMSEMQNTADHLLVIGRGRILADCPIGEVLQNSARHMVRARTPQADELRTVVTQAGGQVSDVGNGVLTMNGVTAEKIGDLAFENRIRLYELTPVQGSLEEAFMELTAADVEFHGGMAGAARQGGSSNENGTGKGA